MMSKDIGYFLGYVGRRGFKVVKDEHRKHTTEITLPTRGTKDSAGYDFYSPSDVEIPPHTKITIWSDVKAYMQPGEVLMMYVRSSIGIKKGLSLANGTGIIDMDYFSNPDNDGNIGICLMNNTPLPVKISQGERIAQGIFMNFLPADNGNSDNERQGGIGSTN
jgi:dUTP pyrophosphatase